MIKIVFVGDTERKIYIGKKEVYDSWHPPTINELSQILRAYEITEGFGNLYHYIVNGGVYQGNLKVTASYEGGNY
ncbi:hypothetical protein [Pelosinus propionicus]|uniref:Uncharacterized protein n=1 Tax=Pelosinus propionicus DSM 13327 TaxID=1123291 RepID=A0A1I4JHV2_9FIRM|nr:hypothetical protein [Pelosinus propionicus]SFL65777.1 hypothetical protein SAMN04490355_101277 [Pelosinus propionicus DSM 13327]